MLEIMRMLGPILKRWRDVSLGMRGPAFGLVIGAFLSVVSALIADALDRYLDVRAPNMIFLCGVILAALWFGRRVALATALFAFFIYNFYLAEPRNTFGFAGFEDILTLLVFIGTAIVIGGLAGTLHDERERAKEQVRIFSGLFDASRALAETDSADRAIELLVARAHQITATRALAFRRCGSETVVAYAEPEDLNCPPDVRGAAEALLSDGHAKSESASTSGWEIHRVGAADEAPTALALGPSKQARSAEYTMAVRLLVEMTNAAIERDRYVRRRLEMDTLAATERLRTALMSSISHDFRTPLSTILTSASSLIVYGERFSQAIRTDLLTSIQEEAERLNRFVGNIMDMTRLDAGVVRPKQEWTDPLEVIENVEERIRKRASAGGRVLRVVAPAAAPAIRVDPLLLEQAITNVVENALVHTPSGSQIRIGAEYSEQEVKLWVEDNGPGVPAAEIETIFDKFHRLSATNDGQGAGLGLAISKGFVEAMDGEVCARSPGTDGRGLRVEFVFKLQSALERA